ncbi:molybdate ABC transporter substrate-binding protein [Reichenbachiella agarivorans]|uniref:Molybdate ABC transporter substrate-binding protein n=1 Tax=Reichenbachiella agarivorans TaxID=2979464 RepID=A0ABY6CM13_9BACT|nr:molybdate ABC transporter substrate-binding protein [Reichenbachiella agarivorans]UXP31120.1 molybdate ABC transporter substrate-binding protein [Reichenbachiella agarivorans]
MLLHLYPKACLIIVLFIYSFTLQAQVIRVAAASSMVDLLHEIKVEFEKTHHQTIEIISGSSGTLTNQILQGAPFDLFFSANIKYTDILKSKGMGIYPPEIFTYSPIVIWTKEAIGSPATYMLSESCQSIGIAQPGLAPFGDMALRYLQTITHESVSHKLVYGSNIAITNQYIYAGSVDLAITSKSSQVKLSRAIPCCWTEVSNSIVPKLPHAFLVLQPNALPLYEYLQEEKNTSRSFENHGYSSSP